MATAELVSYNPLEDLAKAAEASGCRITITLDINPPERPGTGYTESMTREWGRDG
jgi:hypothetical protein